MKAIGLKKYLPIAHEESLLNIELSKPVPLKNEVLVKVKAISVNPIDTKQRAPKEIVEEKYRLLGWDVSGIIEEVGEDSSMFQAGDEVYYSGSLLKQGAYSEYHTVDERLIALKPKSLSFSEAAAFPLTTITAWESLFEHLNINIDKKENQKKTILIIGAAGGVGSIAIQLAKYAGLTVIATASRTESTEWVKQIGADYVINHRMSLQEQLAMLPIKQIDYIFNLSSTDEYFDVMAEIIKPMGSICCLVDNQQPLDMKKLKRKSVNFSWEFMFTRAIYETDDMIEHHKILARLANLIDNNQIQTITKTVLSPMNADTLRKAHKMLESGKTIGKIVVEV